MEENCYCNKCKDTKRDFKDCDCNDNFWCVVGVNCPDFPTCPKNNYCCNDCLNYQDCQNCNNCY